jgi:hypothetical protein
MYFKHFGQAKNVSFRLSAGINPEKFMPGSFFSQFIFENKTSKSESLSSSQLRQDIFEFTLKSILKLS